MSFSLSPYINYEASCGQLRKVHMHPPVHPSKNKLGWNSILNQSSGLRYHFCSGNTSLKSPWFLFLHFYATKSRGSTVSYKFCMIRKELQVYTPPPVNKAKSLQNRKITEKQTPPSKRKITYKIIQRILPGAAKAHYGDEICVHLPLNHPYQSSTKSISVIHY